MLETTPPDSEDDPPRVQGEPSLVDRPFFIVGCHRSGTSILRASLDSHPRMSVGNEDPSLYRLSWTDTDLCRRRREGYGFSEEEWFGLVRRMVEELYMRYAASQGKTRWGLKFPPNSLIIDYLDRLYPGCQVIHIVRHPRDVVASGRRKWGKKTGAYYGRRWVRYVRAAETAGARLGKDRFLTIRYEDLVADPEKVLKEIVKWLGEPWNDEVLHVRRRTHRFPARLIPEAERVEGPPEIHTASVGKGTNTQDFRSLLFVRLKGNDLAKKFGYQVRLVGR